MPGHRAEVPEHHGEPGSVPQDRGGSPAAEAGRVVPAGQPAEGAVGQPAEGAVGQPAEGAVGQPAEGPSRTPEDGRNEPIDPAGVVWSRVDEQYITVRLIGGIGGWLLTATIIAVPLTLSWLGVWGTFPLWLQILAIGVVVVWAVVDIALIPRRMRAIGYEERQDDLLIRRGLLFQRVVSVPYGRMQYVDIEAGPLMRKFGLCTVQLKTASAATDASIPGVVRAEGARLREELSARGQARLAGL